MVRMGREAEEVANRARKEGSFVVGCGTDADDAVMGLM